MNTFPDKTINNEVPLTVAEVSHLIKSQLESEFRALWVAGEVQNLTFSAAGHYYFNLHGEDCALSCVLFRQSLSSDVSQLQTLKNGSTLWLWGDIGYYQKRGQIQLIGKKFKLGDKEGLLKIKLQQLKQKFEQLGYFDLNKKKSIPKIIKKMALVSGLGTAAIRDFLTVYTRRSFHYSIVIFPALVQGDGAPASLMKALEKVKKVGGFDLVVMTRGGGSLEDLWCFNDEKLIEYIYQYAIPVLSAIGHERDHTLIDLVADKSVETPSAAAEFLSLRSFELLDKYLQSARSLKIFSNHLGQNLRSLTERYSTARLTSLLKSKFQLEMSKLVWIQSNLRRSLGNQVPMLRMQLEEFPKLMQTVISTKIQKLSHMIDSRNIFLTAHHPKSILEKGYCLAWKKDGTLINRAHKMTHKDELSSLEFFDGKKHF